MKSFHENWLFSFLFDKISESSFLYSFDKSERGLTMMSAFTQITSTEQLQDLLETSASRPVLLFKHSTRCPISARAYSEVSSYLSGQPNENAIYGLIHVIEDRPVSLEAAELLSVKHESPQAILIKDGKAVWNTSHSGITSKVLKEIL